MKTTIQDIARKDSNTSPFLFLINNKSGTQKHRLLHKALAQLDKTHIDIIETTSKEHAINLCHKAIEEDRTYVVAIGGDGTVNSVGNALINTGLSLGILPMGSGNGIARHLGISMDISEAVEQILQGESRPIDTIKINDQFAIGFAGIGFDAYVAHLFDQHHARGFSSYIKLTLQAYRSYKSTSFTIQRGTAEHYYDLILANTSQLGNNAFINPKGQDNDGHFELLRINKPSFAQFPSAVFQLFNKHLDQSNLVRFSKHEALNIENIDGAFLHIDGEPCGQPKTIETKILPQSLNVITKEHVK